MLLREWENNLKMYQTEHRASLKYSVEAGVAGNGSFGAELRAHSLPQLGSTAVSSAPSSVGGGRLPRSVCPTAGRAERGVIRAG